MGSWRASGTQAAADSQSLPDDATRRGPRFPVTRQPRLRSTTPTLPPHLRHPRHPATRAHPREWTRDLTGFTWPRRSTAARPRSPESTSPRVATVTGTFPRTCAGARPGTDPRPHPRGPLEPRNLHRRPDTHGLPQEEVVPGQVVGAQKAAQDPDRALEQVDVHVFLKPELLRHPLAGFFKLCDRRRGGSGNRLQVPAPP